MPVSSIDLVTVACTACDDPVENPIPTVDDESVCAECAESDYTRCYRCALHTRDTLTTVHGHQICESCAESHYWRCEHCDYYNRGDVYTVADGTDVCSGCIDNHYWGCDQCGDWIDESDYCSSCEEYAHDDCMCEGCTGGNIQDYSYRPAPRFHGEGPLFLGMELEIDVPRGDMRECADIATEHLGRLGYLKEDSSINYGFEIVTHPMSYGWAMDNFPWRMLRDLDNAGCDGDGNGLHVHVSRAGFDNPCHIFRWLKFFYRNQSEVTKVARRTSSYAYFDADARENVKHYAKGRKGDRYQAINTQNDTTLELRMFAATLTAREVKAALGLAAASIEYTRDLTVPDITRRDGWQWPAFAAWVAERPEFAPLAEELDYRGLGQLACAC